MVQKIGQITNADIYINDVDVAGRVMEFELDGIGLKEVDQGRRGFAVGQLCGYRTI